MPCSTDNTPRSFSCHQFPATSLLSACIVLAKELFDVDDEGYAHELNDGVVPPELEEKARLAVDNCPEVAISIEED